MLESVRVLPEAESLNNAETSKENSLNSLICLKLSKRVVEEASTRFSSLVQKEVVNEDDFFFLITCRSWVKE